MKRLKALICLALAVGFSSTALAGSFTFTTGAGSTDSAGDPVSAQAVFVTGNGTLSITLSNLLVNQKDVGQNISDLFFTLNNSALTSGTIGTDGPDALVNVASNGTASSAGTGPSGWLLFFGSGKFLLNGLGGATFVPSHTILGAPGPGGVYSNANGSIAGNNPHNPFINQTATWTLNITGITANTIVTAAIFSFGTTAGNNVPGVPPSVPDGGTAGMLLGASLAGLGLLRRYLKN